MVISYHIHLSHCKIQWNQMNTIKSHNSHRAPQNPIKTIPLKPKKTHSKIPEDPPDKKIQHRLKQKSPVQNQSAQPNIPKKSSAKHLPSAPAPVRSWPPPPNPRSASPSAWPRAQCSRWGRWKAPGLGPGPGLNAGVVYVTQGWSLKLKHFGIFWVDLKFFQLLQVIITGSL